MPFPLAQNDDEEELAQQNPQAPMQPPMQAPVDVNSPEARQFISQYLFNKMQGQGSASKNADDLRKMTAQARQNSDSANLQERMSKASALMGSVGGTPSGSAMEGYGKAQSSVDQQAISDYLNAGKLEEGEENKKLDVAKYLTGKFDTNDFNKEKLAQGAVQNDLNRQTKRAITDQTLESKRQHNEDLQAQKGDKQEENFDKQQKEFATILANSRNSTTIGELQKRQNNADRVQAILDQYPDNNMNPQMQAMFLTDVANLVAPGSVTVEQMKHLSIDDLGQKAAEFAQKILGHPINTGDADFIQQYRDLAKREHGVVKDQLGKNVGTLTLGYSPLFKHRPEQAKAILASQGFDPDMFDENGKYVNTTIGKQRELPSSPPGGTPDSGTAMAAPSTSKIDYSKLSDEELAKLHSQRVGGGR